MVDKKKIFFIILFIVLVYAGVLYYLTPKNETIINADLAINQAKMLFEQKKQRKESFDNGPCLSNALMPGWVADIVHNPHQPIDDLAENQCGLADHFVELDLNGNAVRVK